MIVLIYPVSKAKTGRIIMKPPIIPLTIERTVIGADSRSDVTELIFIIFERPFKGKFKSLSENSFNIFKRILIKSSFLAFKFNSHLN